MLKIALLCGSYDPIHNGHISIAKTIWQYNFDRIDFLVAKQSPYKNKHSSFSCRAEMCQLAAKLLNDEYKHKSRCPAKQQATHFETEKENISINFNGNIQTFYVNLNEGNLNSPSYTAATMRYLIKNHPANYTLVIGEDNFIDLPQWKEAQWILHNFPIMVYPRSQLVATELANNKNTSHKTNIPSNANITIIPAPLLNYNATKIRQLVQENTSIAKYVPKPVEKYIKKHSLYT